MEQLKIHSLNSKELIRNINNELNDSSIEASLIKELFNLLNKNQEDNINLDYTDLLCVADESKTIHLLQTDIQSDVFSKIEHLLKETSGVLIQFKSHPDYPIMNFCNFADKFTEYSNEDASVIWGTNIDKTIKEDESKVSIAIASN